LTQLLLAAADDPAIAAAVQIGFIVSMIAICAGGICCEIARRVRG
jgi:hypothetical protein